MRSEQKKKKWNHISREKNTLNETTSACWISARAIQLYWDYFESTDWAKQQTIDNVLQSPAQRSCTLYKIHITVWRQFKPLFFSLLFCFCSTLNLIIFPASYQFQLQITTSYRFTQFIKCSIRDVQRNKQQIVEYFRISWDKTQPIQMLPFSYFSLLFSSLTFWMAI